MVVACNRPDQITCLPPWSLNYLFPSQTFNFCSLHSLTKESLVFQYSSRVRLCIENNKDNKNKKWLEQLIGQSDLVVGWLVHEGNSSEWVVNWNQLECAVWLVVLEHACDQECTSGKGLFSVLFGWRQFQGPWLVAHSHTQEMLPESFIVGEGQQQSITNHRVDTASPRPCL